MLEVDLLHMVVLFQQNRSLNSSESKVNEPVQVFKSISQLPHAISFSLL